MNENGPKRTPTGKNGRKWAMLESPGRMRIDLRRRAVSRLVYSIRFHLVPSGRCH